MFPTEYSRKERSNRHHFVMDNAWKMFADQKLQNVWKSASVWCEYINEKFSLGEGVCVNPVELGKAYEGIIGADTRVENDLAGNGLSLYQPYLIVGEHWQKQRDPIPTLFLVTKGKP